ncbi:MAG: hypothetical protein IPJ88_04030 [Myxococcales bacterium]|nr:MAG: hypothetical protein IPJ88_04030 [Myxococcales bacterium]
MTKALIAFVTCNKLAELTPDDQLAVRALDALGVQAVPEIWNDSKVEWGKYDALILRSTWDYYLHYDEFMQWLETIETLALPLFNEPSLVRPNSNKRYLRSLSKLGIACIETEWLENPTASSIQTALENQNWSAAVLKPAVSAGAFQTTVIHSNQLEAIKNLTGTWLLQPMLDEIQRDGEWSLIYIDGHFSHCVLKKPKQNDFRVQEEYGGIASAAFSPSTSRQSAEKILASFASTPLYARIDGVMRKQEFQLMEVELIEPSLFFHLAPQAADTFARAILKRLLPR